MKKFALTTSYQERASKFSTLCDSDWRRLIALLPRVKGSTIAFIQRFRAWRSVDADDVAQDAAWEAILRMGMAAALPTGNDSRLFALLKAIARSECAKHLHVEELTNAYLNGVTHDRNGGDDEIGERDFVTVFSSRQPPQQDNVTLARYYLREMRKLPMKHRDVLLAIADGESPIEIAKRMDETPLAVLNLIQEARRWLDGYLA